ncbi:MAG: siroheme synthase CysG [Parvularculaceae bacterium]
MKQFPAFFPLDGRRVVIAGGGELAARKARLVWGENVRVEFIDPQPTGSTRAEWAGRASFVERAAEAADFDGAAIAFVAVEDRGEQARLASAARRVGTPVNVVDRPDVSDFFTPSIVDRGAVTVAIGTGGAAPVLGRRLRRAIDAMAPRRLGELAEFAEGFRRAVAAKIAPAARRGFWERFFDGPAAAAFLAGDDERARALALAAIDAPDASERRGVVHIVGAGPGDPELLTLRAHRLIQSADVILYDRLVGDGVLDLARRDATRIFVGKAKADHAVPQEEIHTRMAALAAEGHVVVRLKGGDPFVFGRGGEELEALRAAGVEAHVTPGVTAAAGCAASVGMPLTHRDHAQAVTFVTGHAKADGEPDLDWGALARLGHTLVVYMGVGKAAAIAQRLIDHGRDPATPAAVIENGARPDELSLVGTLRGLPGMIADGGVVGPALLVVGDVAAFAQPTARARLGAELEKVAA